MLQNLGDPACENPEVFGSTAQKLAKSGALSKAGMKIGKVEINENIWSYASLADWMEAGPNKYEDATKQLEKYNLTQQDSLDDCDTEPENLIRLFKRGRMIKYPKDGSKLTGPVFLEWLQDIVPSLAEEKWDQGVLVFRDDSVPGEIRNGWVIEDKPNIMSLI